MNINEVPEIIYDEMPVKAEIVKSENTEAKNKLHDESSNLCSEYYFDRIKNDKLFLFQSHENGIESINKRDTPHDSSENCQNSKNYKFKCKFCFCITSSLLNHFSKKHRDKELIYRCQFCVFETKYMGNLKEHENSKHEKQYFHLCHICGFRALYRSNLNRHVRQVHLKYTNSNLECNERYICIYCGFVTKRKENLNAHMNSLHTLENIFPCKLCKYVATRNGSLKKHIQSIHKENKPTNYNCHNCNYKTDRRDFFKLHFRKEHEGIKTFACGRCDYKATVSCNLKRHILRKH